MKKFIFILSVIVVLSCILCIGVSANDSVVTDSPTPVVLVPIHSVSSDELLSLSGASSISDLPHVTISGSSLIVQYHESDDIVRFVTRSSVSLRVAYVGGVVYTDGWYTSSTQHFSIDSISASDSFTFTYANGTAANVPSEFRNVDSFFTVSDSNLGTSLGVTTSIGFIGQVLKFITSTSGILTLVGLSIAFAIIPFAVGKVKELIKGY